MTRLNAELGARERALTDARAASSGDAKRVAELLAAAEQRQVEHDTHIEKLRADHAAQIEHVAAEHTSRTAQTQAEQAAKIEQLQSEAEMREEEMTVLVAHLHEARRPIDLIEANVKRLTEELAVKTAGFDEFAEENRKLQAALDRTRGALEEREFLIRRLERSESNNANVLGRIQTSIERLGATQTPAAAAAAASATPVAEWSAEMIRVDGERPVTYVLSNRTRIGRAPGCELQVDSTSVSRHHALLLVGPRECIIEDLNSTNGVIVNGRKVTRQLLNDGDAVTIGEIQFRYSARPTLRPAESHSAEPHSAESLPTGSAPPAPTVAGPKSTGF